MGRFDRVLVLDFGGDCLSWFPAHERRRASPEPDRQPRWLIPRSTARQDSACWRPYLRVVLIAEDVLEPGQCRIEQQREAEPRRFADLRRAAPARHRRIV